MSEFTELHDQVGVVTTIHYLVALNQILMLQSLQYLNLIPKHLLTISKRSIGSIKFPTLQLQQPINFHRILFRISPISNFLNLRKCSFPNLTYFNIIFYFILTILCYCSFYVVCFWYNLWKWNLLFIF